jgi:NDP-4-keto-2,6-dideoxyhexose 3-C-methyltransferase
MADRVGFRFLDVEFNDINGGSFSVTLSKKSASYPCTANVDALIVKETGRGFDTMEPYLAFAQGVGRSRQALRSFLADAKAAGKRVYGLGASTKGNVILQYCGIIEADLPLICEVNSDKFGCFTPGTRIPIVPEQQVLTTQPDYLLVLPWHFRSSFEYNPNYEAATLVFPLPVLTAAPR